MNKTKIIIALIAVIAVVFFYKDWEVNRWKNKVDTATPDTIKIYLEPEDVIIESEADFVDVEFEYVEGVGVDTIWAYKILYDKIEQPLFSLNVICSTKAEKFVYDFDYRSLELKLTFANKYDLKKGFEVTTNPNIGNVKVDWGDYIPAKRKKNFNFSAGFGYSKNIGPMLLSGVHWKKNELGVFMKQKSIGIYFKRIFIKY